MTTLGDQVAHLGRRLQYASAEDELALQAAVLAAAADAQRARPASLHPLIRSHSPAVVAAAREATLRDWLEVRDALVAASLSTAQVAERLGISPAAVTKRRSARALVAFKHRSDWRYPTWQLVGSTVLPGVVEVWRALPQATADPLGLVRWFTLDSTHLGGAPLALLQAGETDRVVDAATYVGLW